MITPASSNKMRIIIAGSTGFVATEVIRQALSISTITSIKAMARRETAVPNNLYPNADESKLSSVVCDDFDNYSDFVKKELSGADACIWLLAVTPSKAKLLPWDQVRKINLDYTITGVETITKLPRAKGSGPFKFIYCSGVNAERDQTKKPWVMGDYSLLRGLAETKVLECAEQSNGECVASVAKPGLITSPEQAIWKSIVQYTICTIVRLPKVTVSEIAAALLGQAVNGIEKETLLNEDLVSIGQAELVNKKHHVTT